MCTASKLFGLPPYAITAGRDIARLFNDLRERNHLIEIKYSGQLYYPSDQLDPAPHRFIDNLQPINAMASSKGLESSEIYDW